MKHLVDVIDSYSPSEVVKITFLRIDEIKSIEVILGAESTKIVKEKICCEYQDNHFNPENISIFPNPVSKEFNLTMDKLNKGKYVFQIFDIDGKRVLSAIENYQAGFTKTFDLAALPVGSYFIKLSKENNSFTQSFIKE